MEAYRNKGRLTQNAAQIERYRSILEKDNFRSDEPHWRRISKNTITLFQVLIDQDLTELILILEHYPKYIEWVCEHFRYAYSYSEKSADIDAASKLLFMGEPYYSKQFVRNVVRKLPIIEEYSLEKIKTFAEQVYEKHEEWNPIVVNHYYDAIQSYTQHKGLHPLQIIALTTPLKKIERKPTYDYEAEDRDAVLDIPYMN